MSDDLFSGVEDVRADEQPSTPSTSPSGALAGGDKIDPVAWAGDLTYAEVHSFTIGFSTTLLAATLTALGAVVASSLFPVAVVLWTAVATLALVAIGQKKLPTRTLRYLPREPHYYFGGTSVALAFSIALLVPLTLILIGAGVIA